MDEIYISEESTAVEDRGTRTMSEDTTAADVLRTMSEKKKTGLELLREPFPAHQISKLPKPTAAQTDAVKADFKKGMRCTVCGAWHHPDVVHLDYVGHAALTYRLLDADPAWQWEPLAMTDGLPRFDESGGLWIKLTVCGVSRLGYGHAIRKERMDAGSREKEVIGDALRNAAMRFGAALDLWHKGQLHEDEPEAEAETKPATEPEHAPRSTRAITAASAEVTPERQQELRIIGKSLIDLVDQEHTDISIDNQWNIWTQLEQINQDDLLWLSNYLTKHTRVLTRCKAVMVAERAKLRADAAKGMPATA